MVIAVVQSFKKQNIAFLNISIIYNKQGLSNTDALIAIDSIKGHEPDNLIKHSVNAD